MIDNTAKLLSDIAKLISLNNSISLKLISNIANYIVNSFSDTTNSFSKISKSFADIAKSCGTILLND